jgi:hypothetical protein
MSSKMNQTMNHETTSARAELEQRRRLATAILTRLLRTVLAVGVGVLGLAGCNAGGAQGGCPALASCGGSPVGTWSTVVDACQFQAVRPAQPVDVMSFGGITPAVAMIAPPQPNPVVAQQTTSGDWCSSLVYNVDDTLLNVALWHDAPLLKSANITYGADNSYLTKLTFSTDVLPPAQNTTHFAPHCLLANGASNPTCAKLTTALTAFYAQTAAQSADPNFTGINCSDSASDGGCDCTYVYTVVVADQGMWAVQGDTLLQDSGNAAYTYNGAAVSSLTPASTMETSFCAGGGLLQLTGYRGGSLFGVLGLRTMVLSTSTP